jgi:hypothetical protein
MVFQTKHLPTAFYLKNPKVVETVAKHLSPNPSQEKCVILEASPGAGLLTRYLLKKGLPHLHVFDYKSFDGFFLCDEVEQQFQSVVRDFPDRITVHHLTDELEGPIPRKLSYYSKICDRLPSFLKLPNTFDSFESQWEADPRVKLFIPTPPEQDSRMFYQIVLDLIRPSGIYSYGRTELLAIISYHAYSEIIADFKVNGIPSTSPSLILQTLFDIEKLQTFPLSSFHPVVVPKTRVYKKSVKSFYDSEKSYLVKLTPKKSLAKDIPVGSWSEYFFFISQTMYKPHGYVIPFFEKWFPGCGYKLIKAGLPIYSQFYSLKPELYLICFKECVSWPEYSTSAFKHIAQSLDPFKQDPVIDVDEESEVQEEESSFS